MRIYLDVCCLNRPFNDQSQVRIRLESEAILHILERVDQGIWSHVSSEMALIEIRSIKQTERRKRILSMLPRAESIILVSDAMLRRAAELGETGIKIADAVHIAAAESVGADVFLTCDDRLLKSATRHASQIGVRVANPVIWIADYEK